MSHFTVAVFCGPDIDPTDDAAVNARVEELMAPYNENMEVPRFKQRPKDKFFFSSLSYDDDLDTSVAGPKPVPPNRETTSKEDWSEAYEVYDKAEAEWFDRLVTALPVETTLKSLNRYGSDEDEYAHDDEGYYYWSTRNPNSKWDYWTIGGRWAGNLVVKDGADFGRNPEVPWEFTFDTKFAAELVGMAYLPGGGLRNMPTAEAHRLGDKNPYHGRQVDIARVGDIDFESKAAVERAERAKALASYDLAVASGDDPTTAAFRYFDWSETPPSTPEEREAFINRIHGLYFYAYVTPDGAWHGKGEMGWWGISHDELPEAEYRAAFDKYLAEVDPQMVIAVTDCHV